MARKHSKTRFDLAKAIGWVKGTVVFLFLISGVINLLALTGSFYMLQVYDRALTSHSVETLIGLSALAIGLYLIQGLLDISRSQILVRIGAKADQKLTPLAHRVAIDMPRFGYSPAEAMDRGRDVDVLRQFISGPGPTALLDLPWMPVYFIFVYLLSPWLAALVAGGALVLTMLTLATELIMRKYGQKAQTATVARATLLDSNVHNAEVLRAMGFRGRLIDRFETANREHLSLQMRATDLSGTLSGVSRVLRMILQSAVLGLGAFLAISGDISAGSIIACSVVAGRALAPIDLAIGQWKNLVMARRSYRRLGETLASIDEAAPLVDLPPPQTSLKVEKMTVTAPGSGLVLLSEVSFELQRGQSVGIIGPSGSGKSSLARALVGVWPLIRGSVRLDEADVRQWDADALGQHIGYLPQDVQLMSGSVAENISRFDPKAEGRDIINAARMAGVHELILRLPEGYETQLGPKGASLSAGQRQRIALARAIYGRPFLVVLDEPNSNLDAEGEAALAGAMLELKEAGSIVVVIAHRPMAIGTVDTIGVMQGGRMVAYGPRDDVLAKFVKPQSPRLVTRPAVAPAATA
ncbi:MAG: type I secretion system permease/ATPase [Hyphomicrobiaceae bacterium]